MKLAHTQRPRLRSGHDTHKQPQLKQHHRHRMRKALLRLDIELILVHIQHILARYSERPSIVKIIRDRRIKLHLLWQRLRDTEIVAHLVPAETQQDKRNLVTDAEAVSAVVLQHVEGVREAFGQRFVCVHGVEVLY